MNTIFILFILWNPEGSATDRLAAAVNSTEFNSEQACRKAASLIYSTVIRKKPYVICVPKGEVNNKK